MGSVETRRRAMYAKIAIGRTQIPDMDDDAYRSLLQQEWGVRSAKELSEHQLARLLQIFAQKFGVVYTSPKRKKPDMRVRASARPDWIEITDSMPHAQIKREICAIWRKLGYDMTSLDTRVQRAFGVPVFLWLQNGDQVSILLSDLPRREKSFDKKHLTTDATVATGETA